MKIKENKKAGYITLIQDFYKKNGRAPLRREFKKAREAIRREFGSWNSAIRAAGLDVTHDFNPTKARLRNSLLEFYAKHKRAPKTRECIKANRLYTPDTYIKHFKVTNWAQVLEKVGLDRFLKYSMLTKDKQLAHEQIVKLIKKEKIIYSADYIRLAKKNRLPSMTFIREQYGGWENLLKKLGLRKELNKEVVGIAVKAYYKKYAKAPTVQMLAQKLKTTVDRIYGLTGSYREFLTGLKVPLNKKVFEKNRLDKEELKQLYIAFSKKNGYENGATIDAINKSGKLPVATVFITQFGSMNDLRKACDYTPVHEHHNAYTRKEIIELLRKEYLLLRRPLSQEEVNQNIHLPHVTTILRYLQVSSFKEVWEIVKKGIRYADSV